MEQGVLRSTRDEPPTHFRFKIESFSSLSKSSIERYESGEFMAGDHKWKLVLYPNGNKKAGGEDHISLYLVLVDKSSLDTNTEILVTFSLFVFDQIQDKYLSIQGGARCLHAMENETGFEKFLPLKTFIDPLKGYLIEDSCIFGAEVFYSKGTAKGECLSMIKNPITCKLRWKIKKFSELKDLSYNSEIFATAGHKWKILLFPKGNSAGLGHLSLFLSLADPETLSPGLKVLVNFTLRVIDQVNGNHVEKTVSVTDAVWLSASTVDWGFCKFLLLGDFNSTNGYLVNDKCIVEAEVILRGVVNNWDYSPADA